MNKIPWWEQSLIVFGFMFLLGGLAWVASDGSAVTGLFAKEVSVQMFDKTITNATALSLNAKTAIRSARIWGSIEGTGDVVIWLVNQRDERLLVFTNVKKHGLEGITGVVAADTVASGTDTVLDDACMNTCIIPLSFATTKYHLVVEIDDGTVLRIQRLQVES